MDIEKKLQDGIPVISLKGDLDLYNAQNVKDWIINEIDGNSFDKLVVNFDNVRYIDSSGIGILVGIYKKINGKIRLCRLQDGVMNVFKLTRLDRFFNIDDTENLSIDLLKG